MAGWMLSHHAQRADSLSSTRGCGFPGSCRWEITDRFVDYTNIDLHLLRIFFEQPSRELKKASNLFCWNLNLPLFSFSFLLPFIFSFLHFNLSLFLSLHVYICVCVCVSANVPSGDVSFMYFSSAILLPSILEPVYDRAVHSQFLTMFRADTKSSPLKIVLADDRWQLGLLILSTSKRNIQQIYKYQMYQYSHYHSTFFFFLHVTLCLLLSIRDFFKNILIFVWICLPTALSRDFKRSTHHFNIVLLEGLCFEM